MRGKSQSRFSPRASKRKNETESNSTSEPKLKRTSKKTGSESKGDKFCWLCHTEANEKICGTCPRTYHNSCLDKASTSFSELGACPECQFSSVDGTELNSDRFFNLDKLKKMLDVLTRRCFDKKRDKNEIFLRWPEEDREDLFQIIDFEILLDRINHVRPYMKTAEFYADVKFIYHNSCIAYGANSDQAKAAENLRRDFKTELLDLEACPECYYYLYCDENDSQDPFVRLCDTPHDIVWAQLTGHPYWPAKSLKVVKGIAHVRFFGKHEQSNIPISKCLFLSESHPKDKDPKSQLYKSAKTELLEYIQRYRRKYGDFPFYPHKTPYKPHEKQSKVEKRKKVQMKLEANMNEDSEMCIIHATSGVDSEDNLTFENSVANDISAPNAHPMNVLIAPTYSSGTEGQYPTLAQINPSIDPSSSPCQGSEAEGQYATFAHLNPTFDPSLSADQDNLNKNPSAVTSINMTFSTDENFNLENANPVVTSIASLPPIDTASNVLSSPSANDSICCEKRLEKFKGFFQHSNPKGTETAHNMIVANNPSNDSLVQPGSLHNIVENFPVYTGNPTEMDDEVLFIGQQRHVEGEADFNPDFVLPILMEENPDLKSLVQRTRYLSDAMIVQLYASFGNNSKYIGKMSKLCVEIRKYKSELKKVLEEKEKLRKEDEANKNYIQGLNDTVNKLEADNRDLQSKIQILKERNTEAAINARMVIKSIKANCSNKVSVVLNNQYLGKINEKDDCILKNKKQLRDAEETVKNVEEENRRLRIELEEAEVEKQRAEDKLKAIKLQISPDTISEYKRTHYCCVCERSAAIVCCLDTSYCSSECQERHAEEHRKHCKSKITSQSFVQQRVISQQSVVMVSRGVITSGRSTINNPSNSEVSETDSTTSSTRHKKPEMHHVSPSALLPTPHYRSSASSSRSYSSKGKRRR